MSPEAQRIAIAESCGFTIDGPPDKKKSIIGWKRNGQYHSILPNYLNDLNAMHEAEETLTDVHWSIYCDVLFGCAPFLPPTTRTSVATRYVIHATAAHRAEAFLRTIGKWKDE